MRKSPNPSIEATSASKLRLLADAPHVERSLGGVMTPTVKLAEFLISAGYFRIALQRSEVGHFLARGRLRGRDVSILVDTGASSTIVSLALARELSLSLSLHTEKGGGAGSGDMDVYVISDASLDVEELDIRPRNLLAMDLGHANEALVANGAPPIEAILGLDVFEMHSAVIDYQSQSLFLRP